MTEKGKPKQTHLIDEYSVAANTIICVCAWKGDADAEWLQHKKDNLYNPVFVKKEPSEFQKRLSRKNRTPSETYY